MINSLYHILYFFVYGSIHSVMVMAWGRPWGGGVTGVGTLATGWWGGGGGVAQKVACRAYLGPVEGLYSGSRGCLRAGWWSPRGGSGVVWYGTVGWV